MRLAELFERNTGEASVNLKITGVLSHILGRLGDTSTDSPVPIKSVLQKLNAVGIHISSEELMNKYKEPPFNEFIANVSGDYVTFLGQEGAEDTQAIEPDQSTDMLDKMAKRAAGKRD
jgi:hypothetical protein